MEILKGMEREKMIRSMTGYGRVSNDSSGRSFNVEIKSVNNRYLDVFIRLPRGINALEDRIRKYVASKVYRGKIDVYINQESFGDDDRAVNVDENIAAAYYNALKTLKDRFGFNDDITLSQLANYPDVISMEKKEEDIEVIWEILLKALDQAIDLFLEMRSSEGEKLGTDIKERCQLIKIKVEEIENRSSGVVDDFREKIRVRVTDYLKEVEIDEARLLNEVAFFADKCSITEEIVRLKSHISQLENTLCDKDTIGRKLDFLIQEMNREINTIGSKANDLYITNLVVDVKSELEKVREQIQNIE
jgi:uncharacterized protein (TIGR00255 family)